MRDDNDEAILTKSLQHYTTLTESHLALAPMLIGKPSAEIINILEGIKNRDQDVLTRLLFEATQMGLVAGVKMLLMLGVNIHAVDAHKNTALHIAAINGNPDVAQVLLEAGAEIESGKDDTAALEEWIPVAEDLNEDIPINDEMEYIFKNKSRPLHIATRRGYTQVIDALLDGGGAY